MGDPMEAKIQLRINRARWWALTHSPFYGSLAMALRDVEDSAIQTACTNGEEIRWNPSFVESITDENLRFILLHETCHCAHEHFWRLPADEMGNQAGDYAINSELSKVQGIAMPKGGLISREFADMPEEKILAILKAREPQNPKSGDKPGKDGNGKPSTDPGKCGGFAKPSPKPGQTPAQVAEKVKALAETWKARVVSAAQVAQAQGCGDLPGGIARQLSKTCAIKEPDWKEVFSDFVRNSCERTRADWTRASKRNAWQPVVYPRRRPDSMGKLLVARDSSGSVTNAQLAQMSQLIEGMMLETQGSIILLDADSRINREMVVQAGEPVPLDSPGGGGTDFRPVFRRVEELLRQGEQIAGIVYLTDLDGPQPDSVPDGVPVLWLCTSKRIAKSGRTVRIL